MSHLLPTCHCDGKLNPLLTSCATGMQQLEHQLLVLALPGLGRILSLDVHAGLLVLVLASA